MSLLGETFLRIHPGLSGRQIAVVEGWIWRVCEEQAREKFSRILKTEPDIIPVGQESQRFCHSVFGEPA